MFFSEHNFLWVHLSSSILLSYYYPQNMGSLGSYCNITMSYWFILLPLIHRTNSTLWLSCCVVWDKAGYCIIPQSRSTIGWGKLCHLIDKIMLSYHKWPNTSLVLAVKGTSGAVCWAGVRTFVCGEVRGCERERRSFKQQGRRVCWRWWTGYGDCDIDVGFVVLKDKFGAAPSELPFVCSAGTKVSYEPWITEQVFGFFVYLVFPS